jgi:TPR repeat protein
MARMGSGRRYPAAGVMVPVIVAAVLVLGMLPGASGGIVSPTVTVVSRLDAPKPWVGEQMVYINETLNTDLIEGTLALGGGFSLVLNHDILPRLAPVKPMFTICMSLFLTNDPSHDTHVGIFWKGENNDDRTPSAWLVPGSTHVTFRVSTKTSTEVWGTSTVGLPVRKWCHIAFSLENRIMRFYIDGTLDAAVSVPDSDVVTNNGNLHLGKDPKNPGFAGFIGDAKMWPFALSDEDTNQLAAVALHRAPDFDGEPQRDAARRAATFGEIDDRRAKHFQKVMDREHGAVDFQSEDDVRNTPAGSGVDGHTVDSSVDTVHGVHSSATAKTALHTEDHLAAYASEQFLLGDEKRARALRLLDNSKQRQSLDVAARGFDDAMHHLASSAAAGNAQARLTYAAMLEHGYGTRNVLSKPGRALYHRLLAAAAGDPLARLAMGAATLVAGLSWEGDVSTRFRASSTPSTHEHQSNNPPSPYQSNPKCQLALHYFFHAAQTAFEESAMPGGQVRVEKGRLSENTRRARGDLRGETDDRVEYLARAADLGDARAMLAMGNSYYWGHFGLPLDHQRALGFYRRAHSAGELRGTVGVAKMVLKGEGGSRNTTEALEYYENAAKRGASDALNGLGYLYFYGESGDEGTMTVGDDEFGDAATTVAENERSSVQSSVNDPVEPPRSANRIKKNDTAALAYFTEAAALGNGDGLVNAGMMLRSGLGAPVDVKAAHAFFVRCADLPGEHSACVYQAALIEATGEGGVHRDCALAARRLRAVAESGRWMTSSGEGMKAHLAKEHHAAEWAYLYASAGSAPAAVFNAAWLNEGTARALRVTRRFLDSGAEAYFGDEDGYDDAIDEEGTSHDDSDVDTKTSDWLVFLREKRSTSAFRRHALRLVSDPDADVAMQAWAWNALGDCFYFGERRAGGCPRNFQKALKSYRRANAFARLAISLHTETEASNVTKATRESAARAAEDTGTALDPMRLVTNALSSEAWMRFAGEGCARDARFAKGLLKQALGLGGWRELVALVPAYVALTAFEFGNSACLCLTGTACPYPSVSSFLGGRRDGHREKANDDFKTIDSKKSQPKKLPLAGFALRSVSDALAFLTSIEDSVTNFFDTWKFTLTLLWSVGSACVGAAVGWRLVVRPFFTALVDRVRIFENARNENAIDDAIAAGNAGGTSMEEMMLRIERMRAETAEREAQANAAAEVHGEESDDEHETETIDLRANMRAASMEERSLSETRHSVDAEASHDEGGSVHINTSNDSIANVTNTTEAFVEGQVADAGEGRTETET